MAYYLVSMLLQSLSTELLSSLFWIPFIFNINALVRINHTTYATGANETLIALFGYLVGYTTTTVDSFISCVSYLHNHRH